MRVILKNFPAEERPAKAAAAEAAAAPSEYKSQLTADVDTDARGTRHEDGRGNAAGAVSGHGVEGIKMKLSTGTCHGA